MHGQTIDESLRRARGRLGARSPSPAVDARVLMQHALGVSATALLARGDRLLDEAETERFDRLVAARAEGRPIAHLVGRREFWSLALEVDPDVLVPRPETELVVERGLAQLAGVTSPVVLDVGTGSGAIAVAVARERPDARVIASDVCDAALRVAARNARAHGCGTLAMVQASWLGPFAARCFDLIAWNPPYVAAGDPCLGEGDLRFEPRRALVGGRDGLDPVRDHGGAAVAALREGGWLVVEHGADQGAPVRALLAGAGLGEIVTHRDVAGRERVTEGRRRGSLVPTVLES